MTGTTLVTDSLAHAFGRNMQSASNQPTILTQRSVCAMVLLCYVVIGCGGVALHVLVWHSPGEIEAPHHHHRAGHCQHSHHHHHHSEGVPDGKLPKSHDPNDCVICGTLSQQANCCPLSNESISLGETPDSSFRFECKIVSQTSLLSAKSRGPPLLA